MNLGWVHGKFFIPTLFSNNCDLQLLIPSQLAPSTHLLVIKLAQAQAADIAAQMDIVDKNLVEDPVQPHILVGCHRGFIDHQLDGIRSVHAEMAGGLEFYLRKRL